MAVVVTVAKGYDLGYIWKTQGEAAGRATGGYYINAAQAGEPPGRWWGPGAQALGLTPGPDRAAQAVRGGLPADRPAHRRQARPGPRPVRHVRRSPGPAEGRRAARHRRAADRAGTRGGAGDPPACRLHRRDGVVLQVHLGAARLDPGERAPRPPGRGPAGRRVLGRARAGVPGDLAPGQPGGAGVPAGLGRGHPHRLPRHPDRRPGAGPVRARRADRHVLAAGHQPGRRPPGPRSQPDRPDHPDLQRRQVARPGHDERARGPGRLAGRRRHRGRVRADGRVRRGVDPARRRARQRDRRCHAGADGRVLHADRAGAREGTRARAGLGAQARPRADLARAAVHRQRRHAAVAPGQGRGPGRLGRAGRAVGRHARRRAGRRRARGVDRARPGRTGGASITVAARRPGRPRGRPRRGRWPRPWSWSRPSTRPGPGTTWSSSSPWSCRPRPGR